MELSELLSEERCCTDIEASSSKRLLEAVAGAFAASVPELDENDLFMQLMARERLGNTGIGEGVAIPHCRASNCTRAFGALLRLAQPLAFDAMDGKPVDLIFALVVPEEAHSDHLSALAAVAEKFQQPDFRRQLRASDSASSMYRAAIAAETTSAGG